MVVYVVNYYYVYINNEIWNACCSLKSYSLILEERNQYNSSIRVFTDYNDIAVDGYVIVSTTSIQFRTH